MWRVILGRVAGRVLPGKPGCLNSWSTKASGGRCQRCAVVANWLSILFHELYQLSTYLLGKQETSPCRRRRLVPRPVLTPAHFAHFPEHRWVKVEVSTCSRVLSAFCHLSTWTILRRAALRLRLPSVQYSTVPLFLTCVRDYLGEYDHCRISITYCVYTCMWVYIICRVWESDDIEPISTIILKPHRFNCALDSD